MQYIWPLDSFDSLSLFCSPLEHQCIPTLFLLTHKVHSRTWGKLLIRNLYLATILHIRQRPYVHVQPVSLAHTLSCTLRLLDPRPTHSRHQKLECRLWSAGRQTASFTTLCSQPSEERELEQAGTRCKARACARPSFLLPGRRLHTSSALAISGRCWRFGDVGESGVNSRNCKCLISYRCWVKASVYLHQPHKPRICICVSEE